MDPRRESVAAGKRQFLRDFRISLSPPPAVALVLPVGEQLTSDKGVKESDSSLTLSQQNAV